MVVCICIQSPMMMTLPADLSGPANLAASCPSVQCVAAYRGMYSPESSCRPQPDSYFLGNIHTTKDNLGLKHADHWHQSPCFAFRQRHRCFRCPIRSFSLEPRYHQA